MNYLPSKLTTEYPDLVVIVGSPRSGTTYLNEVFHHSLRCSISSEVKFIIPLKKRLARFGDLRVEDNLRKLVQQIHSQTVFQHMHHKRQIITTEQEFLDRIEKPTYTDVIYAAIRLIADKKDNIHRLAYKFPGDVMHLTELADLLPSARFVHIIRDGRDVSESHKHKQWGSTNVYSGLHNWVKFTSQGRMDGKRLQPERYYEFRYEDLILSTPETVNKLITYINHGVPNAESAAHMIDYVNATKRVDRVYAWKSALTTRQQQLAEAVAGELLQELGYEVKFKQHYLPPWQAGYFRASDIVNRTINKLSVIRSGFRLST